MKIDKPLNRFWNRSQFFYRLRFKLLLEEIEPNALTFLDFNKYNPIDSIPEIYFRVNSEIFKNKNQDLTDFEMALTIAKWINRHINGGKGLGLDSGNTLKLMLSGGYGVCSDFSQIFNNFCVVNNLKVREWGLNTMSFDAGGHSLNEVYCKELKKWILVDVSKSIYFISTINSSQKPLSVLEVFTISRNEGLKEMVFFNPKVEPDLLKIDQYYYSKNIQPFLIDEYRNRLYDQLLKVFNFLPIPFIHGIPILLNKSYKFKKIKLPSSPIN